MDLSKTKTMMWTWLATVLEPNHHLPWVKTNPKYQQRNPNQKGTSILDNTATRQHGKWERENPETIVLVGAVVGGVVLREDGLEAVVKRGVERSWQQFRGLLECNHAFSHGVYSIGNPSRAIHSASYIVGCVPYNEREYVHLLNVTRINQVYMYSIVCYLLPDINRVPSHTISPYSSDLAYELSLSQSLQENRQFDIIHSFGTSPPSQFPFLAKVGQSL